MFGGSFLGQTFFGGLSASEAALVIVLATMSLAPRIAVGIHLQAKVAGSLEISPVIDATPEFFSEE